MQMTTLQRRLPRALQVLLFGLYSLSLVCFASIILSRLFFGLTGYPYNTPFLDQYFPDFLNFRVRFNYFHTPLFFSDPDFFSPRNPIPFMYPAPVAIVYKIFYLFGEPALIIFLIFTAAVFIACCLLFGRALHRRGFVWTTSYLWPLLVLFCCYPFWFTLKQANMEGITWLLVTTGLFCFIKHKDQQAAIWFAIAGAFKIYPIVYLALLTVRGRYRAIIIGLLVGTGATVLSLWTVGGSILSSQHEITRGLDTFKTMIMLHKKQPELSFDHSLFALLKHLRRTLPPSDRLAPVLSAYLVCAAVLICGFFFLRVRRLPVLNQITFLTVSSILFPPTSYEYTLTHLLLPLGCMALALIDAREVNLRSSPLTIAIFAIMILLAPLPEIIVKGQRLEGPLKCLVLAGLWILTIKQPLEFISNEVKALTNGEVSLGPRSLESPSPA